MKNYNSKDIGGFINIGTGKDLMIKELADIIKNIMGFKGNIKWDTSIPDGTTKKLLDVSKLHKQGWKDKITLSNGIKKEYENYCK